MTDFRQDTADEVSGDTFAPLDDNGDRPPRVFFEVRSPHVMLAEPDGAHIRCELERDDQSRVTIREDAGRHIADVTVHIPDSEEATEETIAIASARYWSWWRARAMRGEAPAEASS